MCIHLWFKTPHQDRSLGSRVTELLCITRATDCQPMCRTVPFTKSAVHSFWRVLATDEHFRPTTMPRIGQDSTFLVHTIICRIGKDSTSPRTCSIYISGRVGDDTNKRGTRKEPGFISNFTADWQMFEMETIAEVSVKVQKNRWKWRRVSIPMSRQSLVNLRENLGDLELTSLHYNITGKSHRCCGSTY